MGQNGYGQAKKHVFGSAADARRMHDRLVAQKLAQGYRDPKAVPPTLAATRPRDAALEAAIRADRDDPAAYEVYADWVRSRGNPLGERSVLQPALDVSQSFLTRAGIRALRDAFRGVDVVAGEQRTPFDDGERYVAVGE